MRYIRDVMVIDAYRYFRESPKFNKLKGEEYLFLEYKCPLEIDLAPIWSEYHYIVFVLSGKKTWCTRERQWTVHQGDSIFIHKGAYFTRQYFELDYCVLIFFFSDNFIRKFADEFQTSLPVFKDAVPDSDPIYPIEVSDSLQSLYYSVFTYLDQEAPAPKAIVELKFRELILNILTNPANRKLSRFFMTLAKQQKSSMKRIMEDNYQFNLSLPEYARLCGRSLSSFKRDFKEEFHTTPGKWLSERRLRYAGEQLLRSGDSIQEICYNSGFENPSHFSRAFKKQYGETPQSYRSRQETAGA